MSSKPSRLKARWPRLADQAAVRRQLVDGKSLLTVFDQYSDGVAIMGEREWTLLSVADGTRDPDGILAAAHGRGVRVSRADLLDFLIALERSGLIEDGPPREILNVSNADHAQAPWANDPLDPLPHFTFSCHGRGWCCQVFSSTLFGPLEVARARALVPARLDAGAYPERMFTPERGSAPSPVHCPTYIDGRCAYLDDDGACAIHRAGGAQAKPQGCQVFPNTYVADGEAIRVSIRPECSCVFDSLEEAEGDTLLPPGAHRGADLNSAVLVRPLPSSIELDAGRAVDRADYVAWSRAQLERIDWVDLEKRDVAQILWTLADALSTQGLPRHLDVKGGASPLNSPRLGRWLATIHEKLDRRISHDRWRSRRDVVGRAFAKLREATTWLLDRISEIGPTPPLLVTQPRNEVFYLRTCLHGHRFFDDNSPVAIDLRERAGRLLLARALGHVVNVHDGNEPGLDWSHPLAIVEASIRGYGLGGHDALGDT